MPEKRQNIGVISNLGVIDPKAYLKENELDKHGDTVTLGRRSTASDIVNTMHASDVILFTGSVDNVLVADGDILRVNWESNLVRRGLVAFLYMLQGNDRELFEKKALFFCFSAQLLSLAIALNEHPKVRHLNWKNLEALEAKKSPLKSILESEDWKMPLHVLKNYEAGVRKTEAGREVLVSHGQAISPLMETYLTDVEFRLAGKERILESGRIEGSQWVLHQGHADYNARLMKVLHPELRQAIPPHTRNPLITALTPIQHDSHSSRKLGMARSVTRGFGTLASALQRVAPRRRDPELQRVAS